MIEETLLEKMLKHTYKMYLEAEKDRMIYGDSLIEFSDRKMEIIR